MSAPVFLDDDPTFISELPEPLAQERKRLQLEVTRVIHIKDINVKPPKLSYIGEHPMHHENTVVMPIAQIAALSGIISPQTRPRLHQHWLRYAFKIGLFALIGVALGYVIASEIEHFEAVLSQSDDLHTRCLTHANIDKKRCLDTLAPTAMNAEQCNEQFNQTLTQCWKQL